MTTATITLEIRRDDGSTATAGVSTVDWKVECEDSLYPGELRVLSQIVSAMQRSGSFGKTRERIAEVAFPHEVNGG